MEDQVQNGDHSFLLGTIEKRGGALISKTAAATSVKKDRFSLPNNNEDRMRPFNFNKEANNPLNKSIDFASL